MITGSTAVEAGVAAAIGAGIVVAINYGVWSPPTQKGITKPKSKTAVQDNTKHRMTLLWVSVLPWIPFVFTTFIGAEMPCNADGRIDREVMLRTFGSAGSVSALNAITMFMFVECLTVIKRRWMCSVVETFVLSLVGVLLFWLWHLFALVWISELLLPDHEGLYIALHVTTLVLGLGLGIAAGFKSVITSFPRSSHHDTGARIWSGAVITAAVVGGVVLLGASTDSVLVGVIGELPVISIITAAWVYFDVDGEELEHVRCWVHSIQVPRGFRI